MQNSTPTRTRTTPQTSHNTVGGQFGILKLSYPETPLQRMRQDVSVGVQTLDGTDKKKDPVHLTGMRKVIDPPNLDMWRDKLFNVNEMIYLTEDE